LVTLNNVEEFQTKCGKEIEEFLYTKSKFSEHTATAYRKDIEQFLATVLGKSIDTVSGTHFDKVDFPMLRAYFDGLYRSKEFSNSTINRAISAVKMMLGHLKFVKEINCDLDFLDHIENLPNDSKQIGHMPLDMAKQYAEIAGRYEKYNAKQKRLLILLAIETALRRSDCLSLEWSQFTVYDDYVIIRGFEKGGKSYIKKIGVPLYNELLSIKKGKKVFELSPKNVIDMMNRLKKLMNHENMNYSFHSFRKTAVTFVYRNTGDVLEAQKIANHSSLNSTRLYLEEEDYGIVGAISLGEGVNHDMYKTVPYGVLMEALESMNKDSLFMLNIRIKEQLDKKKKTN